MKTLKVTFAIVALAMFSLFAIDAQAQGGPRTGVGQLAAGLVNVQVGAVVVDVELDNVLNNFTLINVEDVLNDADIDILNNILNNSPILSQNQDFLNNLLQGAEILTENQVVVGILSGQVVYQILP